MRSATDEDWYQADADSALGRFAVKLARVILPPCSFLAGLGSIVMAALVLITTVDVILRYFFNRPWIGTFEATGFMMAIFVAFYIAYCAVQESHVRLSLFADKFSRRTRAVIVAVTFGVTSGLCLIMSWASVVYGMDLKRIGDYAPMTHIPTYLFVFVVAFGFAMLSLVWIIKTMRNIAEAMKNE